MSCQRGMPLLQSVGGEGGGGLKNLSALFVSTSVAPQAYDRDSSDQRTLKDPQDPVIPKPARNTTKTSAAPTGSPRRPQRARREGRTQAGG